MAEGDHAAWSPKAGEVTVEPIYTQILIRHALFLTGQLAVAGQARAAVMAGACAPDGPP